MMKRSVSASVTSATVLGLSMFAGALGLVPMMAPAPCLAGQALPPPPAPDLIPKAATARPIVPLAKVVEKGTGPIPMVLIPGIVGDPGVWDTFMERNASAFTMLAVMLPGFMGTEPPPLPEGQSFPELPATHNAVRALVQMIEQRRLDKPVLVGHGYGGQLALRVALLRPELVRGVVCIDAHPSSSVAVPGAKPTQAERLDIIKRTYLERFLTMSDQQWHDEQYVNALRLVTDDARARAIAGLMNKTDRGVQTHYYLEWMMCDVAPEMERNIIPALFIAPLMAIDMPEARLRGAWKAELGAPPKTTLVFFKDCRHFVMDDNPQQLDADIGAFVRGEAIPDAQSSSARSAAPEAPAR